MSYTVGANGAIQVEKAAPAEPEPIRIQDSMIMAAGKSVAEKTGEQQTAVQKLGGKMSGGAGVEVKNIPSFPTAGTGPNPKQVFADMQGLKALATENGKFDDLGSAPPQTVGGRKRKTRKGNARRRHTHSRKRGGSVKRHRRVHHSGRRVHSLRRKSAHKK